ncbi:transporter [Paraflavitalea sp. CAU 1676]|uniref:transporter n=1 Tax=Paraflavitalea sp. CAU 1676 TaxID=3032598 RepID=UPI0023DB868E|nr:transporter [Paraflavitalea sp. CAU 1676]MDF2187014.1 transporter [Paraflavitalea sp. CAU 1676]
MKKILAVLTVPLLLSANQLHAQGCVAIRSTGTVCTKPDATTDGLQGWQINTTYRYFRSFRHFVGTEEQKERLEKNTEVINWSSNLDLAVVRHFNRRWSLAMNLPIISNVRSSLYEHGGNSAKNARHKTRSFGLGDIRFTGYYWLFDPAKSPNANVQVGLGIKLPTGDYKYEDFFVKNDTTKILGPLDQSIQLGDGGTGLTTEINAYYNFSKVISVYGSFFYLFNPREQNGVSTGRGSPVSATAIAYGSSVMSVPDQYMVRAGANFTVSRFSASAGMRMECVPSEDLIGGSSGFRRPGYVISAEPGLSYNFKKFSAFATVPVALKRDRTQSYADKQRTKITGVYAQGDAAFADYSINLGCSFRL